MTKHTTLYGWHLSYFSGKTRAYLHYKDIPFVDQDVNFNTLFFKIKKHTGERVMPVVLTDDGKWLQDSRHIIDTYEQDYPTGNVFPKDPLVRFVSELIEAWADEWWIPHAMHARWSYPENHTFFQAEAGHHLLPWAPTCLQNKVALITMNAMRSYLPRVGIIPTQLALLDNWLDTTLTELNEHFTYHPYLLGHRPSIADFGLMGPMYGHLSRDPWPKQHLIANYPALKRWIDAMNTVRHTQLDTAELATIPPSLNPILRKIGHEFLPMIKAILAQLNSRLPSVDKHRSLPRAIGAITFPMAGGPYQRQGLAFSLFKIQQTLLVYQHAPPSEQTRIKQFLHSFQADDFLTLHIPPLSRVGLRVKLVPGDTLSQTR